MGEALFALVITLAVVLTIVTVVGHGFWVLLSRLAAIGRGPEESRRLAMDKLRQNIAELRQLGALDPQQCEALASIIERRSPAPLPKEFLNSANAKQAEPAEVPLVSAPDAEQPDLVPAAVITAAEPQPVRSRVEEFFAHRAADREQADDGAPQPQQTPISEPKPKSKPKRAWSEVLAAFMEERHIRWGELVGGLLIVLCSAALVISFWADIAERPFLKFFVFNGVTAALFGLGLYAERRWKLETTSRGVLTIASLLVPLNFLAIAAFSIGQAPLNVWTLGGELFSIALFGTLLFLTGRVLLAKGPLLFAISVIVPSILTLVIRRHVTPDLPSWLVLLIGSTIAASFVASNQIFLQRLRSEEPFDPAARNLLQLLGISAFAAALPMALLVYKSGDPRATLAMLSPLAAAFGAPALVASLLCWRRLTNSRDTGLRTFATSVGAFGTMLMLAAIGFGWPHPQYMLPAAAIDFAVLITIALVYSIPTLHVPSSACLAFACLLGWLLAREDITWTMNSEGMLRSLQSVSAAWGISLVAMVGTGVAAALQRLADRRHALWQLPTVVGLAAVSIVTISIHGLGRYQDTSGAVWIYALYGIAALALAVTISHAAFAWLGLLLVAIAFIQGIVFAYAGQLDFADGWLAALLLYALSTTTLVAVARVVRFNRLQVFQEPARMLALVASAAGTVWLSRLIPSAPPQLPLQAFGALAIVWLTLALIGQQIPLFVAAQLALVMTVLFGAATALEGQAWTTSVRSLWLDPRSVQVYGIALVGLAAVWMGLRLSMQRASQPNAASDSRPSWIVKVTAPLHAMLNSTPVTLDRVLTWIVLAVLMMLAVYAAVPGAMVELSPNARGSAAAAIRVVTELRQYEIPGIPHEHAYGFGSWLLLGVCVVLLVATLRERFRTWILIGLLFAFAAAVPLLAAPFESQAAVASALRWLSSFYLLLASVLVWTRNAWMDRLRHFGLGTPDQTSARSRVVLGIFALGIAPLVIMFGYVAIAALQRVPPTVDQQSLMAAFAMLFVFAGLIAVAVDRIVDSRKLATKLDFARLSTTLLMLLAAAPLIAVSLYVLVTALQQQPIHGVNPDAIFARMGTAASYAIPIFITAAVLVGYGVRERDANFAFSGGVLLCIASTAAYLLSLARSGRGLDATEWVRLAQLNAVVAAIYASGWTGVVWAGTRRELHEHEQTRSARPLLASFAALPVALHALVLLTAAAELFVSAVPAPFHLTAGDWRGWISLSITFAASAFVLWQRWRSSGADRSILATRISDVLSAALLMTGLMVVCTSAQWDRNNWVSYHTLLIALIVSTAAPLLDYVIHRIDRVRRGVPGELEHWRLSDRAVKLSTLLGAITVVVALRALQGDPQAPWWTIATLVALVPLCTAIACAAMRHGYLYFAAMLINVAASLTWQELTVQHRLIDFVHLNILALSLPIPLWVWLQRTRWSSGDGQSAMRLPPVHRCAAWVATGALAILVAVGLQQDLSGASSLRPSWFAWVAFAATFVGMLACLWDAYMRSTVAALYVLGLVACAMTVDVFDLPPDWLVWTGSIVVAAYCVATSYLWSRRAGLVGVATALGIPVSDRLLTAERWILPANGLLVLAVVVLGFRVQLTNDDLSLRILSAQAILAQALAVGLLARGERRSVLQYAALLVGALGAVAFGWAWIEPLPRDPVLHYSIHTLAALVLVMAAYGLGFSKVIRRENDWTLAAERLVPVLAGAGVVSFAFVLWRELDSFLARLPVPVQFAEVIVVVVSLLGIAVSCLAAALIPGRDPFGLSERQRTAYVYVTEIVVALLFLHIRVTLPWLFRGWLIQFWPILVVLLAFLGVALSELFRRQGRQVLAEPLERTGAFLPLLPILGFWIVPSVTHFSVVMLASGGVYMALAVLRRSFAFGVMAALAANIGLWYFLHYTAEAGIWVHPQLWLIPPALCVLIGTYLNQDRLSESQMASLRYFAAAAIYVSSTADIFLNGVANAPWLPLVLGGLSIAGIFAGIWLRVRGFLFLGTAFLVLALFTIVWYAAVDLRQTWIWAVTGIITGVLIIVLFALFEKKRQEVLRLVDQLKEWRP